MDRAVDRLVASCDPSVRYLALTDVLGESPRSRRAHEARAAIPDSPRVRALSRDYGVHPYDDRRPYPPVRSAGGTRACERRAPRVSNVECIEWDADHLTVQALRVLAAAGRV